MPLLSDIQNAGGPGIPCDIFQIPINALRAAADGITSLKDNPPAGINQIGQSLQSMPAPTLGTGDALAQGFQGLLSELPGDSSSITAPLSGSMTNLFDGIGSQLSAPLGNTFGNFSGIQGLSGLQFGEGGSASGSIDLLQRIDAMIASIPTPFTTEDLLKFLRDNLRNLPLENLPVQNLPILQELRDKLDTALRWNALDAAGLAQEIAHSMDRVAATIHDQFITYGVGAAAAELERLAGEVNHAAIAEAFDDLHTGMGALATQVNGGDISGASADIALVMSRLETLRGALGNIHTELLQGQANAAASQLQSLPDNLKERAYSLFLMVNPRSDLEWVKWLFQQINTAIENAGTDLFVEKIGEFLGTIRRTLNSLNISAVKDTLVGIINTAVEGITTVRNFILQLTIEFHGIMDRVRSAISSLGIGDLADQLEQTLRGFTDQVSNTVETLFAPVRNILNSAFSALSTVLGQLDPSTIIGTLQDILSNFTNLLQNPQLLQAIDTVKKALDDVNGELAGFSFKPGTDIVIDGISAVKTALKAAGNIPIPDALKPPIQAGLALLPDNLDGPIDFLLNKLDELIDQNVLPFLDKVKEGPQALVDFLSQYSPQKLVGDCLSASYQDMLDELARFKPSDLLAPVQVAVDSLRDRLLDSIDPSALLAPLQAPFDELLRLIDTFDPMVILGPLEEQLQAGIHLITDNLPLDPINDVFDAIASVADKIQSAKDTLTELRDIGTQLQSKLSGLQDSEQQIADFGATVSGKLGTLSDITPVTTAMNGIQTSLTEVHEAGLIAVLHTAVEGILPTLAALDAKNKLVRLAADFTSFPRTALDGLPPSLNHTLLDEFLASFNPVSPEFAAPVDFLDVWAERLQQADQDFSAGIVGWNAEFLQPDGPLMRLYEPGLTPASLQARLQTTLEEQLTSALGPVFRCFDHLHTTINGLITEVSAFLLDIENIIQQILDVTDALEELRVAINGLVDDLNNISLQFIADEVSATFDLIKEELSAISPAHIGELLRAALEDLLGVLDIRKLLGADTLDAQFLHIIDQLRDLDPGKIIVEALQPTFNALLELIARFDISDQVEDFETQINRLREELRRELNRCGDAFEDMLKAIPSSLSESGASVSASVSF
jgi:hypothetical protein